MESANLTDMNIDKIAALFPNCITETADENGKLKKAINFEMLRAMLSEYIAEGDEAYEFTWVGKKAAIAEANRPIRKALRPCVEESVNWDSTENLYIEGDNLEVLKLLQESYLGKVKMIYIDPPYNTGNDFIYRDDFAISSDDYAEESGQLDDEGNRLFKNTDSNGRFHSDWCSMIYSRLMLARNLLADDGVIFISIDDNEVGNLRKICDDIYGGESFIAEFPRITKKGGKSTNTYAKNHDYVLAFCKNANAVNIKGIEHNDDGFKFTDEFAPERGPYKLNQTLDYNTLGYINSLDYPITIENTTFFPGGVSETEYLKRKNDNPKDGYRWRWSKEKFDFGYKNGWIVVSNSGRIYTKTYLNASIEKDSNGNYYIVYNRRTKPISTLEITDNSYSNDNSAKEIQDVLGKSIFDYVKPTSMINLFMRTVTDYDSIILDFFSGSATTAHAVMQLNAADGGHRKFIMVQLPEETDKDSEAYRAGYKNICEIGKGKLTLPKLKDLRKTLEKDSFFIKNNNVTLSGAGPLNNIAALDVKISEIEDQIKQTPAFQEIEKMLSDAKGMVLKDIIETHPDIVEYLAKDKLGSLRRILWESYLRQHRIYRDEEKVHPSLKLKAQRYV